MIDELETVTEEEGNELEHIGILRKSGRYPWGSGKTPNQRNKSFLDYVDELRKQGLSDVDIAKGMGMFSEDGKGISTTELRAVSSIAKNALKKAEIAQAMSLKAQGLSNVAIGVKMGKNESSIRALLDPSIQARADILEATANMLKDNIEKKGFLDVGIGTEHHIGVSDTKLKIAVAMLREEGYPLYYVKTPQLGTSNFTTVKVLAPPGTTWAQVVNNPDKIKTITDYSEDGGKNYFGSPVDEARTKMRELNYIKRIPEILELLKGDK